MRSFLFLLLVHATIILALPARDDVAAALEVASPIDQITASETIFVSQSTDTSIPLSPLLIRRQNNPASSVIKAFCTNPSANFNTAVLSAASEFCVRFLNIKTSTVQVTSGTTATVSVTGPSVSTATVRTTITETVTPPATTVTIPSTFTEPGTTETVTAPRSTITVFKTNTVTKGTTKTVFTKTVTQTSYVAYDKRQGGAPGILGSYANSVVSTVCKCLAKTPTVTRTSVIATTKTVFPTDASPSTTSVTVTDRVTTELEEFTRSIFTTITLPGEEETTTVTSSPATVTQTINKTVTTTDTVKTVTTKTTKIRSTSRR